MCEERKNLFAERMRGVRPTRKEMRKVEVTQCFFCKERDRKAKRVERRKRGDGESRRTNSKGEGGVVLWKSALYGRNEK